MPRLHPWLQPPRRLLALLLAVTIVPSAGLAWLGWNQLQGDTALAERQLEERLEASLDLIVEQLRDAIRIDAADTPVARSLESPHALAVSLGSRGEVVHRGAPLVFRPNLAPETTSSAGDWADAERDELRPGGLPDAIAAYRRMARTSDPAIRAGALVRLARALRRADRPGDALPVYEELRAVDARVFGEPAALVAGLARLNVLSELGDDAERARETTRLRDGLAHGRWAIDRTTFLAYWFQVVDDEARADAAMPERLALADAVGGLWREWQAGRESAAAAWSGSRVVWSDDGSGVTVVWSGRGDTLDVFAAAPAYFDGLAEQARPALGAHVALVSDEGRMVVAADLSGPAVNRSRAETGLPWEVRVASATPTADLAAITARRRNLLWVLSLAAFLAVAGMYFVARGVRRELAVSRLQSEFVSAVSHEFRTPLTSMSHLIEILRDRPGLDPARRMRYYDALEQEAGRLRRFVDSLLDFGRIDARTTPYTFAVTEPAALVSDVVEAFRTTAAGQAHDVALTCEPALPSVRADRDALGLAVGNLLDNAAKYSATGSAIRIQVGYTRQGVCIQVRDWGVGIPRSEQRAIFDRFVRGETARVSGVRGTGVGLALVRQVVHDHGGTVAVESEPGAGSTFTIALPAADGVPAMPAARPA